MTPNQQKVLESQSSLERTQRIDTIAAVAAYSPFHTDNVTDFALIKVLYSNDELTRAPDGRLVPQFIVDEAVTYAAAVSSRLAADGDPALVQINEELLIEERNLRSVLLSHAALHGRVAGRTETGRNTKDMVESARDRLNIFYNSQTGKIFLPDPKQNPPQVYDLSSLVRDGDADTLQLLRSYLLLKMKRGLISRLEYFSAVESLDQGSLFSPYVLDLAIQENPELTLEKFAVALKFIADFTEEGTVLNGVYAADQKIRVLVGYIQIGNEQVERRKILAYLAYRNPEWYQEVIEPMLEIESEIGKILQQYGVRSSHWSPPEKKSRVKLHRDNPFLLRPWNFTDDVVNGDGWRATERSAELRRNSDLSRFRKNFLQKCRIGGFADSALYEIYPVNIWEVVESDVHKARLSLLFKIWVMLKSGELTSDDKLIENLLGEILGYQVDFAKLANIH